MGYNVSLDIASNLALSDVDIDIEKYRKALECLSMFLNFPFVFSISLIKINSVCGMIFQVVIGDHEGILQVFGIKKGEVQVRIG